MKQADALRVAEKGEAAAERAREALAELGEKGEEAAHSARTYARAKHSAFVIVNYARAVGMTLQVPSPIGGAEPINTGLIVVPPMPSGVSRAELGLTEDFEWPEGFVMGRLGDANERKAAAEALVADLMMMRDNAKNAWQAAKVVVDTHRAEVSWAQSLLRAEQNEDAIDTMAGSSLQSPSERASRSRYAFGPPPSDDDFRRTFG